MKANIVKIGNSKGVRIPKVLLEESGLSDVVDIRAQVGKIIITTDKKTPRVNEEALLSEAALSDWLRPEEDEAWASLQ